MTADSPMLPTNVQQGGAIRLSGTILVVSGQPPPDIGGQVGGYKPIFLNQAKKNPTPVKGKGLM